MVKSRKNRIVSNIKYIIIYQSPLGRSSWVQVAAGEQASARCWLTETHYIDQSLNLNDRLKDHLDFDNEESECLVKHL